MFIHDIGLWVRVSKYKDGSYHDEWYKPEEFKHQDMAQGTAKVLYNGEVLCTLRESTKNYFWIERVTEFKSKPKSTDAHLNDHDADDQKRLEKISAKLDKAINDLSNIKSVIDNMKAAQ